MNNIVHTYEFGGTDFESNQETQKIVNLNLKNAFI